MNIELIKWFIKEREAIRNGKVTEDYVLKNSRFCNIHREDDKVSKWIFANCTTIKQLLFARLINRIDLLEELQQCQWSMKTYIQRDGPYTNAGAYQFYPRKGETMKDILVNVEAKANELAEMIGNASPEATIRSLTAECAQLLGRPLYFYFMMVILDAGWMQLSNVDMNSEPYMGPGGKKPLKALGMTLEEISKELQLPMYDVEHILCEVRKYTDRKENGIPNNRKRN